MIRPLLLSIAAGALVAGCADAPVTPAVPTPAVSPAAVVPAAAPPIVPGTAVTVTDVTDGDTFRVGEEKYRVMVMDSCERGATGWRDARNDARGLLDGQTVTLTGEPGVDLDRYGRHLVYVQLPDGRDYAETMLAEPHTGVYAKTSDASPERMAAGRAADSDGRDCGEDTTPATAATSSSARTTTATPDDRETNRRDYTGDSRSNAEINTEASGDEVTTSGESQYQWGCVEGNFPDGVC